MNRKILALMVAALFYADAAEAEIAERRVDERSFRESQHRLLSEAIPDVNKDGFISHHEVEKMARDMYRLTTKDDATPDSVTLEEMKEVILQSLAPEHRELSKKGVEANTPQHFGILDLNKDGFVTEEEYVLLMLNAARNIDPEAFQGKGIPVYPKKPQEPIIFLPHDKR